MTDEIDSLTEDELLLAEKELLADDKLACENDYFTFFCQAWDTINSDSPLVLNWHVKYLCDLMQEEIVRIGTRKPKTKDIIINICPRSLKTFITSIMLPAWAWTRYPSIKFVYASYSADLSLDASVACRRVIGSEWYQERWGDNYKLLGDSNIKSFYTNTSGGHRLATSIAATVVGRGGDFLCGDDLVNPKEVESEVHRKNANDFWNKILKTRLNDPAVGVRVMVMQRSHEEDTAGFVLSNNPTAYNHVNIPATCEEGSFPSPKEIIANYTKGTDGKHYFFPERFSLAVLNEILKSLGEYSYAGQYLQAPAPLEGGHFKRWYWNYWQPIGAKLPAVVIKDANGKLISKEAVELPITFEEKINSWDMTFKGTDGTDFVVGHKVARVGQDKYFLDEARDRMEFPRAVEEVKRMRFSDPKTSAVYIEDKANGSAIIAQLQSEIPGIVPVRPDISKVARAMPVVRQAESGNIYLPHPAICNWTNPFIEEHASFPNGRNDDRVDAASQAISKLSEMKIRMINMFDKERKQHFRPFDINMKQRTQYDTIYGTFYQERNNRLSMVVGLWEGLGKHLYVVREHVDINPVPEIFLPPVTHWLSKKYALGIKDVNWWCNEAFEGKPEKPSTSHMYNSLNIFPQLNDEFDKQTAVLLLNQMFGKNQITIESECSSLANQLNEWYQEGSVKEDIFDFEKDKGLVLALCLLCGVLVQEKKIEDKRIRPYSAEAMDIRNRMEGLSEAPQSKITGDVDAWMGV